MKKKKLAQVMVGSVFVINFLTNTVLAILAGVMLHFDLVGPAIGFLMLGMYVFLTASLGTLLASRAGRPLFDRVAALSEAMEQVSHGDFSVRVPEDGGIEELAVMEKSFNAMAKKLGNNELMRNDFIENVSHEFKTPLAAMEGFASLLTKEDVTPEKRKEYGERIVNASRRLHELTGNILLLSRLEHSSVSLEQSTFRLDEQIRSCFLTLEPAWSEKNLEPDLNLATCVYTGNEALLSQVWTNLIGNAIKFSPEGGTIFVTMEKAENAVTVSVRDEGCGISEEARERIFEKFYQADRSHATKGNGLGLTLAKKIVELHGGSIRADNASPRGAMFTVRLPIS